MKIGYGIVSRPEPSDPLRKKQIGNNNGKMVARRGTSEEKKK